MDKFITLLPDVLMVCGAGAISYGAGILHPAAGFMVAGVLLIAAGILAAANGQKKKVET